MLRRRREMLAGFQDRGRVLRSYRKRMDTLPGQLLRFPLASHYGDMLNLQPGTRLLQVGGSPELGGWLAELAGSEDFVSLHPSRAGRPDLVAWTSSLPLRNSSIDALLAPDLIRRLNDDELWQFLSEAGRVVREAGIILLVDVPPVKSRVIERWHGVVIGGQRRGWGSLLHTISETGLFSSAQLVDPGPSLWPPVPRIGIRLVRRED